MPSIVDIRHPEYTANFEDWAKFRAIYSGGRLFIDRYLEALSAREGTEAFLKRKKMSYNPAFAKEAVDEIKNSIFQRLVDITRSGGDPTYQSAVCGKEGGVDRTGSSMDCFIGREVLPELLPMGRVGIYVDMPPVGGVPTLADVRSIRPYVYTYRCEDICSWVFNQGYNTNEFRSILLRDYILDVDPETGLPKGEICRYRRFWVVDGFVRVQDYMPNEKGEYESLDYQQLQITKIPFYLANIGTSLLTDVADYQIALLNMASTDVAYTLNANLPMYVEQRDSRVESLNFRSGGDDASESTARTSRQERTRSGTTIGRTYPVGTDAPSFIHPSPEPLRASMEKQEAMKRDIRELVNLSTANVDPKMASAESKTMDQAGLESGLSYIGLELENMERKIAEYWAMYMNGPPATIFYPAVYRIKSQADKDAEANNIKDTLSSIPSRTYQKEACKKIAKLTIGRDIDEETLDKIKSEIDSADYMSSAVDDITKDVEIGLVDLNTASEARGYAPGAVDKAAKDHAERLARIAESQSSQNQVPDSPGARGVQVQDGNPTTSGTAEKKASLDTTKDGVVKNKQRGKGK